MNGNMLVKDQMWHFAVVFWIPAFAGMTAGTGAEVLHSFRNRLISLEQRRTRRKMGKWLQAIVILRVPSCSSWLINRNCKSKRVRNCLEFPTVHPEVSKGDPRSLPFVLHDPARIGFIRLKNSGHL
jgi:hypothetical protein